MSTMVEVKLGLNPLARISFYDDDPIDQLSLCWALSYDIDNAIAYMGMNYWDTLLLDYACKIVKVNVATMAFIAKLVLPVDLPGTSNIIGMTYHPENGFIYVYKRSNNTPFSSNLYEIRISDFTIARTKYFANNRYPETRFQIHETLFANATLGKIYFASNGFRPTIFDPPADVAQQSYIRSFDITTFTEDAAGAAIGGLGHWELITAKAYEKCENKFYCTYPTAPDPSSPPNLIMNVAEVDTLTMTTTRTLELPLLPTGGNGSGEKMDISDTHIYILSKDGIASPAAFYIQVIAMNTMTYVGAVLIATSSGYSPVDMGDLGILRDDNILVVYCDSSSLVNEGAMYKEYDISAVSGMPVQINEVIFDDPDFFEISDENTTIVTSQKYNQ